MVMMGIIKSINHFRIMLPRRKHMEYLIVLSRLVVVIAVFWAVAILMGKRHIGVLAIFDFIIAVTLGALAGADLADPKVPHGPTLMTIVLLGVFHFLLSRTLLKRRKIARWLTFDPTVVMQNGVIRKENLAKIRYTVDELLSHLRGKDVFDLQEVEFAVLESNGTLSVQKKSQYQPVTPKDLSLATSYQGLAVPLIIEGRINGKGLKSTGLTEEWLLDKIRQSGYATPFPTQRLDK